MKISARLRKLHELQREKNLPIKERVDDFFSKRRNSSWFYYSRLKTLQSFAQKIETGRIKDPSQLEDYFACTLVVENLKEIRSALNLIQEHFDIIERKPQSDHFTEKPFDSFRFDDLRVYVEYKDDPALPPSGLTGVRFEIQIKTFLQHAWGIATHDLVYKTNEISWGKKRIAYQIRALLEHAEISIEEAELLSNNSSIAKEDRLTKRIISIVNFLVSKWNKSDLPYDLIRLAESVDGLLNFFRINLEDLSIILENESKQGRGIHLTNLSPYGILIQSLLFADRTRFCANLLENTKRKSIYIPDEIVIHDFDWNKARNIVRLLDSDA